jgi:hypothetical protein
MKLGVTGTRSGMTDHQLKEVEDFLRRIFCHGDELHHGDCIGVDVQVAYLAYTIGYKIICHPPIDQCLRAASGFNDVVHEPKTHFARNRSIVDSVDFLMVVPLEASPQPKGGTWYTRDYAVKKKVDHHIFYPELLLGFVL